MATTTGTVDTVIFTYLGKLSLKVQIKIVSIPSIPLFIGRVVVIRKTPYAYTSTSRMRSEHIQTTTHLTGQPLSRHYDHPACPPSESCKERWNIADRYVLLVEAIQHRNNGSSRCQSHAPFHRYQEQHPHGRHQHVTDSHTFWIFSSYGYERNSKEQSYFLIQPRPAPAVTTAGTKGGDDDMTVSGWSEPWWKLRRSLGGRYGWQAEGFGGLSLSGRRDIETFMESGSVAWML